MGQSREQVGTVGSQHTSGGLPRLEKGCWMYTHSICYRWGGRNGLAGGLCWNEEALELMHTVLAYRGGRTGESWLFFSPPPSVLLRSESESRSVVSNSLRPHRLYSPWNSPGQNTGVGSRSLLHGIFPTQGSNPGLLHCRQILYQLSHKGSPRILEWVAYPYSSRSSRPRNRTGVSCIAGRFFTNWAIREALILRNSWCKSWDFIISLKY